MDSITRHRYPQGMTLVELLVVLAIMSILGVAIYNLFATHNRQALIREETALMQQELLSAMTSMADSIRMCGYSPNTNATDNFGFTPITNQTQINCTQDADGNGTFDGSDNEITTFYFNATTNSIQKFSTGTVPWQPLAINIGDLQFTYLDADGNVISDPNANLESIRMVQINATAIPSSNRANMGIRNRTMTTVVQVRNAK
jgi:prepilin-type N-terminal cleavage/methylation domain-containing protein